MRKSSCLAIILLLTSLRTLGQFGNEWIEFNQEYFKIKIVESDFYRITSAELEAVGFPVSTIDPDRIQLFRNGEEIAILVDAGGGGINIEFYAEAIDGSSDADLYDFGDQPNVFVNNFSDTASYFLTYELSPSVDGKRIPFSSDQDATGLTPEDYHLQEDVLFYDDKYAKGHQFGSKSAFSLSKYDTGEGWTGFFSSKGTFTDHEFQLTNRIVGTEPTCDFILTGGNSLNHVADISVGPSTSDLTQVHTSTFTGWIFGFDSFFIPESSIGADDELTVRIERTGVDGQSERFAVTYVRVGYQQEIAMLPSENKIFTLDSPPTRAYLQIETTANPAVYDITDPANAVWYATREFSDRIDVVLPTASNQQKILAVTSPSSVASIKPVSIPEPAIAGKDYLVITHPNLRTDGDPITDFKNYRESAAGGSHEVLIVEIQDLYNLFNYGDPSPLAIRRFVRYAASVSTIQNVFLIGKGYSFIINSEGVEDRNYLKDSVEVANIPTFGIPGSDLMYTLGINTDANAPGIPIGRLNAYEPEQVTAYLDKVIEMEALPFDQLWRKDFLQLSGGSTQNELIQFAENILGFAEVLEEDFIGGRAFNTGKQTSETIEFIPVTDVVNDGVGYITFFGHSGGSNTDIEIGRVSEPEFGFSNTGRYPIFLVNGCRAGEIFGDLVTFGEDWLSTPDLGAIGFMAHSSVATASTLRNWSDIYYATAFGNEDYIGESIGNILVEVSRQYLEQFGSSNAHLTQLQQMLYEGDPAIRIFGADHPDYQIDDTSLFAESLEGGEVLATQDSFRLNIVVKNFGRTVRDSVLVQVDRTLPDGSVLNYVDYFARPLRQDTLNFFITNDQTLNNVGQNLFTVRLDPLDSTTELNETNNVGSLAVSIFDGNTTNLFPVDHATIGGTTVEFVWQASDLLSEERGFELEFDTEQDFGSPNRQIFSVTGEVLLRQQFDFSSLSLPDSSVIFWRTRLADPGPDETDNWVTSDFTLVNGIAEGWGQYENTQLPEGEIRGIEFTEASGLWEFIQTTTPIDISTFGIAHPTFGYGDIEATVGGTDLMVTFSSDSCHFDGLHAIAFDRESGDAYNPIETSVIDFFNDEVCGRNPQRIYSFEEGALLTNDRLQVLVDNMRDGDYIVLYTIGHVMFSNWDADVLSTLNSLGVSSATVAGLVDGQPVIMLGRKGDAPSSAVTVLNDGTPTPVTEQSIRLQDDVFGSFSSGEVRSGPIGPASAWGEYTVTISEELNDSFTVEVFGIDVMGNADPLPSFEVARTENFDLSTIDVNQYPQIELVFTFSDDTDLTPPQFGLWQVNYDLPPDGMIVSESTSLSVFQEGQEIQRALAFYNYSDLDFSDSLDVELRLINQQSGDFQLETVRIPPPLAGDSSEISTSFSSLGFTGPNSLVVSVAANENEAYTFNNRLTLANLIQVEEDNTNPVLDVTFDGNHILDGDIVSPTPTIAVRVRDENQFLFKSDTTGIDLYLRDPSEGDVYERISFSEANISFTPATEDQDMEIVFEPGQLENGVYGFRVQAEDETGNDSGIEPYEISFEVINESTVTHFYPYPNPFSTSCRFVFTLTGSTIPDQMKIQIMTVTGRVVREITQSEIGAIRIGNNITEYAWDGRDEFGDLLANGVYFYRVFLNANGEQLEHRSTAADGAFKRGFGKLYILR